MLPSNIRKHGVSSLYLKRVFFISKSIINIDIALKMEFNSRKEECRGCVTAHICCGEGFPSRTCLSQHADRGFFGLPHCSHACKARGLETFHCVYQNDGHLLGSH